MLVKQKALEMRRALELPQTESPILFINLKTTERALKAAKELHKNNFFIPAIRYPTVPKDRQGLRIVICRHHTKEEMEKLAELIKKIRH